MGERAGAWCWTSLKLLIVRLSNGGGVCQVGMALRDGWMAL